MSASEELLKAEASDASGDHGAALQHLVAAAKGGQLDALFQLGQRYLVGDRAPCSPPHAVQLLQQAVGAGETRAALLLSVLHALGVHVPQSWDAALSLLVQAAIRGNTDAQDQLVILSANRKLASKRSGTQEYWIELGRSIDLAWWHQGAGVTVLSESPHLVLVPSFAPKELCQWLIKKAVGKLAPALVYDSVHQQTIQHQTRSNSSAVFGLVDTSVALTLLQIRIAATLQIPLNQLEPATVLHYKGGEQIHDHYDFIDPTSPNYKEQIARNGDRIVTFLTYLNDNYEGGVTDFPKAGKHHKGTRGEALFIVNVLPDGQPDVQTMHAGRPPTAGEKWVMTQFIRSRPAP